MTPAENVIRWINIDDRLRGQWLRHLVMANMEWTACTVDEFLVAVWPDGYTPDVIRWDEADLSEIAEHWNATAL